MHYCNKKKDRILVNGSTLFWILHPVTINSLFLLFNLNRNKQKNRKFYCGNNVCFKIESIEKNNRNRIKKSRNKFFKRLEKRKWNYSIFKIKRGFRKKTWMNTYSFLDFHSDFLAAWPSGKAGDCKSFIPSSNLGAAWSKKYLGL